jgi:tRNA (cytidine56-2'-O)-methyltransferase
MPGVAKRNVTVLRLGHRPERDKRITTHVGLVARAFGANSMIITTPDAGIIERIRRVDENFGGNFHVSYAPDWKSLIRGFDGLTVHLTMYGEKFTDAMRKIDANSNLLVIVGSEKIPADVYDLADLNISVGNQPHSEVAALAIFLDRLLAGFWEINQMHGRLKIIPSERKKTVMNEED